MNQESHENAPSLSSLVWWRRFPSVPRSVALARRAVTDGLRALGVAESGVQDVALVVSELVTNAVRHGLVPGRLVEVRLEYDLEKAVTVEVSDAGDHRPPPAAPPLPCAVEPTALTESGRGLALVAAFAAEWGVRDRVVGKTVWGPACWWGHVRRHEQSGAEAAPRGCDGRSARAPGTCSRPVRNSSDLVSTEGDLSA
ncbi:Anti-sigma regulatory factor (Ser/Thr protein kinase) [Streptomyces sp. WMMB 714]|uniref:ATP-binding protein n=1 Tax=Streptomyces sp. WMMB 714 TaxID=1286822 RepID=UPI000823DE41|nr:ATP-binding protein [Streptomyces sp. WMMB 714]SCK36139.1 Anti-sigma regulatory factor (Ser/Thr protein kinase) [Streptomyces sp. WMMB 714]